jgi:glycosyltransferase involved in cell wall biosynthesis
MNVTVSVGGKFHAFHLSKELEKRKCLETLITTYPKFEVIKSGVSADKIISFPEVEVASRLFGKLPFILQKKYNPQYVLADYFDKRASKKIEEPDICVSWSSYGLHTIGQAKKKGAKTIIERGSSHIAYQTDLLKEEYDRLNIPLPRLAHPSIIEKEIQEYEEADYVSIPSSFVRRTFIERGVNEDKLIQIPYGVDLSLFKKVPKNDSVFRIIFAGGMRVRKGVHYLLQAFSELNLPNAELVLLGTLDDEMKPFFKRYDGNFVWKGHIKQEELYKEYSQGSVFVIPSIEEGLALVQVQAMACGLPLICTENSGGEDLIDDGREGFIIPIRDIEALKDKIIHLYENPEKVKEMGDNARERVVKGFSWSDYGDKIVREYKRILYEK